MTSLYVRALESSAQYSISNDVIDIISQFKSLTKLCIGTTDDIHIETIKGLLQCYQSSLKELRLFIMSHNFLMNGHDLEKILEPCKNLHTLSFVVKFYDQYMNVNVHDLYRQFQSEWWLDSHRPPVLVLRDQSNHIFIGSMPCDQSMDITFPMNPNEWQLNKGPLNSDILRFTKMKSIHCQNNNQQKITIEFLRLIDRSFPSLKEKLTLNYWGFDSSMTLFTQVCFLYVTLLKINH